MRASTVREVGAILRRRRRQLLLTQADLAELAGVSRPWLSDLERGKATAEVGRVLRVIDALALDLELRPRFAEDLSLPEGVDLDQLLENYER